MSVLKKIYLASFFFALNAAFGAYINSTVISQYIPEKFLGLLYSASAVLAIIGLTLSPKLIARFGNRKAAIVSIGLSCVALLSIALFKNPLVGLVSFLIYLTSNILTVFFMDIFVEHLSKDQTTGKTRGLYLTIISIAWLCSPILVGKIISIGDYRAVYLVSAVYAILSLLIISFGVKSSLFKDGKYYVMNLKKTFSILKKDKDTLKIISLSFLLNFFYAWMIIYTPIYLHNYIGFDWKTMGKIFTFMLLPFVLLEFPLGRIVDGRIKETKILSLGLLIAGIATFILGVMNSQSALVWAGLLFATRVGASSIEAMVEVFFFKQITEKDTDIISVFRDMGPLAYIVAPVLGTVILLVANNQTLFMILGALLIFGLGISLSIKDRHQHERVSS